MLQQTSSLKDKRNSKYLVLQIRFLLNRYHGREWPPSPRKLFLALVSALYQSSNQRIDIDKGEKALKLLESLQAPTIHTSGHKGCMYTISVPNNDCDLISKGYAKGTYSNKDPKELTTSKNMTPYIADTIQYSWDIDSDYQSKEHADVLCQLVKEISVLGLGIDPVAACGNITDSIPHIKNTEIYTQDENTTNVRIQVPISGFLKDAKRHYKEFLERVKGDVFIKPVPMTKYKEQKYRKDKQITKCFFFKITNVDNERNFIQKNTIPEMVKEIKKVMQIKESRIKTVILPSIGNRYADGQVRRVGFLVPPDIGKESKMTNKLRAQTIDLKGQKYHLEPLSDNDEVKNAYQTPSRSWCAVTQVDLQIPRNATRQDITENILNALNMENINETVTFVNFRKEPYWNGLPKISNTSVAYSKVIKDNEDIQNANKLPSTPNTNTSLYVEIEFKSKVTGPFLIGQNQDLGHGLFAPNKMPSIAYFTVLGKRPSVEKTIKVSELMRRSVMSKIAKTLGNQSIPEYISGHDHMRKPLRNNHMQAFWLPVDTDHDGFIDHVAVYVQTGFEKNIQNIFYNIKELNNGHGLELSMFFNGFYNKKDLEKKCDLFKKCKEWVSVTPYFMPWHIKKNFGRDSQIIKECKKRRYDIEDIEDHEISASKRQIPNTRFHNIHKKSKPINSTGHAIKLSFKEPIRGPISLGYCSHFGLGMFMPKE